jgi:hypothetical protein
LAADPAGRYLGMIAGVRIGAVPHPAMFLAFADGAGFKQD